MKRTLSVLLFCLCYFYATAQKSPYESLQAIVQPQDLKKDIDTWMDWLHATHPNIAYTVKDVDRFYKSVAQIRDGINSPISSLEFWKRLSVMNSQLSDGHTLVAGINTDVVTDYIAKGGTLFPFEVVFDQDALLIKSNLGGTITDYKGYVITSINDISIDTIKHNLLIRTNGDSDDQRKAVLQRRFSIYMMLFYGENKIYHIGLRKGRQTKELTVNSLNKVPLNYVTPSFNDVYQFRLLDKKNALITIRSFNWDDKKSYMNFMEAAFIKLQQNQITHLIIDIRENGGGNDDLWMEGILKYIADKPYRWGSVYKKKIISKYRHEGEVIGTLTTGQIETIIPVDTISKYKFTGKVSVIIGPYTYSSSILFANTVQDYKFAQLVGEATGGKSGQTGSVQTSKMPNSGLTMITPRFYLERPNGGRAHEPVAPDIKIRYDQLNPDDLIKTLLKTHFTIPASL